jgi:hypothetical protein
MTALYVAVKVNESGERLCMETLIDMSRGYFSTEDFEEAEMDMVDSLQWRLSPPTANCFMVELWKHYHKEVPEEWVSLCEEILEMSVADAYFVPRKKSQLAVAAILLSGEKMWFAPGRIGSVLSYHQRHCGCEQRRVSRYSDASPLPLDMWAMDLNACNFIS